MILRNLKPIAMGALMAVGMLWMLHEQIMEGTFEWGWAAVGFVAAHLAVLVVALGVLAALPAVRRRVVRHRPSARHMGGMVLGAILAGAAIHGVIHGVLA